LSLTPGTRLGVYEIIAQIGEGGMGQVFRARDTKLNRDVALKVLPDSLARFTREAQTLAHMSRAIRALTGSPLGGWRRSNPFKTGHARAA
jgi:serine/threonine protein kinase